MLEQLGGSRQDEDETEPPKGSPDPAMLIAVTGGRFDHHLLFPRADGSAKTRDITFVSFCRRRASDQVMQNCPEDIPAREVKSWAQVVEWWGGGEYKAVAKDAKHRTVACFPSASGEWITFDGDSKPFVLRKGYSTLDAAVAHSTANAAPAAPAPHDALLGVMAQVLHELRTRHAPAAPPPPAADGLLVAMIQAQAAQATATIQAQAAQATSTIQAQAAEATATSHANVQIIQTLLSIVAQRSAEPATRPVDPTTLALQQISAMQKLVPPPAVAPGLAEQIAMIKALRDLYQPAPVASTSALQPFVNIFGQVMTADATRSQAERAQTPTVPQQAPTPHPPPRPRPALLHVPGIGIVKVVEPEAGALYFDDMSTEELVAAIRKDPALLRELGVGLAPAQIAPVVPMIAVAPVVVAPSSPASFAGLSVVEPAPAIPVVPDLEPTSVLMVVATPPAAALTVSSPSVFVAAPCDSQNCDRRGQQHGGVRMAPQHRNAHPRARASATSPECHRARLSAASFSDAASRAARGVRRGRQGASLSTSLHARAAEQRREESDVGDRDEAKRNQPTRDGGARVLGPRLREEPLGDLGQGFVQVRIPLDSAGHSATTRPPVPEHPAAIGAQRRVPLRDRSAGTRG